MKRTALVLTVGLAWSLFVCLPARSGFAVLAGGVMFTIAPYAALALVARWIRPGVLGAAVAVVLAGNVTVWLGVRSSSSSTAPVAMVLGPMLLTVTVVPIAALVSWAWTRLAALCDTAASRGSR